MSLFTPNYLRNAIPLSPSGCRLLEKNRAQASLALSKNAPFLTVFLGPCSIHDEEEAFAYGELLHNIAPKLPHLFLVMRVFLEKPRTRSGWKGFLYDPTLDGKNDVAQGIWRGRSLFCRLGDLGIPLVTELLEPLSLPYFVDCLTWGIIGARTSASQPHRQIASSLPFPVGFKNDIHGEIDVAISGILSARSPHSFLHVADEGTIEILSTSGNPLAHLVLRGGSHTSNYDALSVAKALSALRENGLEPKVCIDCAHGNSQKVAKKQREVFLDILQQIEEGNSSIFGVMLESHLHAGRQPFSPTPSLYGVSLTDPCLGWEETEDLLYRAEMTMAQGVKAF